MRGLPGHRYTCSARGIGPELAVASILWAAAENLSENDSNLFNKDKSPESPPTRNLYAARHPQPSCVPPRAHPFFSSTFGLSSTADFRFHPPAAPSSAPCTTPAHFHTYPSLHSMCIRPASAAKRLPSDGFIERAPNPPSLTLCSSSEGAPPIKH